MDIWVGTKFRQKYKALNEKKKTTVAPLANEM